MTPSLSTLVEAACAFDEQEAWRRCGYDSELEPQVMFIVGGARGE